MKKSRNTVIVITASLVWFAVSPLAVAAEKRPVTADNFPRAETDLAIRVIYDEVGLGKFTHNRAPTAIDKQNVIRMNRDTLYSRLVLDLSKPAKITMPETDGRYMSLQVINQDHFTRVFIKPGIYEITQDDVGTRYAYVIVRTFVDASDKNDIKAANALQDKLTIEGGGWAPLDLPDWNKDDAGKVRDALLVLASTLSETSGFFGTPEQTTPVHQLIGSAWGWGGMSTKNAVYVNVTPQQNDGKTPHVFTVKDVPVDAFWSITVYNAKGFIEPNDANVYAFNDRTAKPNDDGSYTIYFGGCDDPKKANCLPITDGWNYIARMYEPRQEIRDGTWKFPPPKPMR